MGFIEDMQERGLIAQFTHEHEFKEHLAEKPRWAYVGFDPSADSLHVGHLLPLMMLVRWQKAGHKAIALMGGGTVMVGDPTGKTDLRQILSLKAIEQNIRKIKRQVSNILDLSPERGLLLNNADWLLDLNYLDFLREIGSKFSVNRMLTAECFKQRLEKGLSFLEFNYMLLQAYDFLYLHRHNDCTVQLGGDDQWSNILAGADLIRRFQESSKAFCLTNPLLLTSDGKKMGKTEKGSVWLDPDKTSPYEYFQYWRNIPDDMVANCFRYFTFVAGDEIKAIEKLQGADINKAKIKLAYEATKIVHGADQAKQAQQTAHGLFGDGASVFGDGVASGNEPEFLVKSSTLKNPKPLVDILVEVGIFSSKTEARKLIVQGGLALNGKKVHDISEMLKKDDFSKDGDCLLKKGKKHYYRLRISD